MMRSNSLIFPIQLIMIMLLIFFMAKITNASTNTYLHRVLTSNNTVSLSGCEDHCGNVSIPYPFGTREGCYRSKQFYINCNTTYSPPKAFLRRGNIEVTEVSLLGHIILLQYVAKECYYPNGTLMYGNPSRTKLSAYSVYNSSVNKFIGIGCDTYATIEGYYLGGLYRTGCVSSCTGMNQLGTTNGSCSGVGCCQIPIPRGIWNMNISVRSLNSFRDVNDTNIDRCSFAFVAGKSAFNFTPDIYTELKKVKSTVPSVVDWFIGNTSCKEGQKNLTRYACKSINSQCYEPFATSGLPSYYYLSGYRCSCKEGFDGNPYIEEGCKDINECEPPHYNYVNCKKNSRCNNTYGNYTCICLDGFHGDGREGCTPVQGLNLLDKLLIGGAIGATILLASGGWLYFALIQRRKMDRKKIKFFKENGGVMLLEQLIQMGKSITAVKIFTSEELKQATNNYDESRIVGQGGFGIVYKGYLPDDVVVAIKKSKKVDGTQTEEFVNEVIVLSQINHRNAVKLLGCCFETEVPFLVYEYIDNGTLYDHLHDKFKMLSLQTRLTIATGTAEVLSYLHSAASTPIIHRDVKSTNILLDNSYTAKVSDFGASRLVPLDETTFSTMVRGTLGYLDPEYMQTSQLTDRSDVYSFGVVLAELLTGKKAISFERSDEERSLANHFLLAIKRNRLLDVVDRHILSDGNTERLLVRRVAMLVKRCLNVKGEDRPTMKEVATELQGILEKIVSSNYDQQLTSYGSRFIIPDDCDSDKLIDAALNEEITSAFTTL